MTQFIKPRGQRQYPELGFEAGVKAMVDAGITYDDVQAGIACYCYGGSTCGERVFYHFGMTSIPIYNTRNACATGSAGLQLARTLVKSGTVDCVLVVGFEQMVAGPLTGADDGRPSPVELSVDLMRKNYGKHSTPQNAQFFANAGREYMEKYGAAAEDFAEIARVSHEHSQRNPYAQFRQEYTLKEILDSPMIHAPLTKLQCSPTSDGSAAAVVVSKRFLDSHPNLKKDQTILLAGQALRTDNSSLYSGSAMDLVGFGMTKEAVKAALNEAKVSIKDVAVCELHDCFSCNELVLLEGLGFCEQGKAHELVRAKDITYGGRVVINPSGGLISKGHPLGATGLAQCAELTWQLRGWANNRLVNTKVALQHNLGLGGCVVVTVYKRPDGKDNRKLSNEEVVEASNFDYNPAVEARYVTKADFEKVRSRVSRVEYALSDTMEKIQARL